MSRKYVPPFPTLALVQSAGGGLYTGCDIFSRDYAPSSPPRLDREMFTGSVDAGFLLALPFHHGDLEPDCVGVSTRGWGDGGDRAYRTRGGKMLLTLAVPRIAVPFERHPYSWLFARNCSSGEGLRKRVTLFPDLSVIYVVQFA